jgi:hypothetical protein
MPFRHGRKCRSTLVRRAWCDYCERVNTTTSHHTSRSNSAAALAAMAPDLNRRPPRSPRVQLGGYVILPRCLDKGRATIAGTAGEYHFACLLDQQFLQFVGIEPAELRTQLEAGKSDSEILAWVNQHARHRRSPAEVDAWVRHQEKRGPNAELQDYFGELKEKVAPQRADITSWFEILDVDDYVSFGGRS